MNRRALACAVLASTLLAACGKGDKKKKPPDAKPAPQPEPDPEPPILSPGACPRLSSSATPIDCFEGLSCPNGVYNVSCTQISGAPPVMSCSCTMPNGAIVYRVLDGSSMQVCDTMASLCY